MYITKRIDKSRLADSLKHHPPLPSNEYGKKSTMLNVKKSFKTPKYICNALVLLFIKFIREAGLIFQSIEQRQQC